MRIAIEVDAKGRASIQVRNLISPKTPVEPIQTVLALNSVIGGMLFGMMTRPPDLAEAQSTEGESTDDRTQTENP